MARCRWAPALAAIAAAVSLFAGCSRTGPAEDRPSDDGSRASPEEALRLRLDRIATLEEPVAMATRPGETDPVLYVAEKTGRVVSVPVQEGSGVVLDLTGRVSLGNEQGLLGIAFSPDGRYLYTNRTDTQGDTRITEFAFEGGRAIVSSERDVLIVDQPYANHNGGGLAFGPDGYLYIALGDGGSGGDPHGNGQSLSTLLGKLLRIDPRPSAHDPYAIPRDNPFVGRRGVRPEIWAYGLRNPWRFSFDRETGDLWIGDVGQGKWEEIDVEASGSEGGRNYGWNVLEGSEPYLGGSTRGMTPPVYEYFNDDAACAVTGGYVYRGADIPTLQGWYVFADYCEGRVRALRIGQDGSVHERPLNVSAEAITSFGEDAAGELYVLSRAGGVYRLVSSEA